MPTRWEGLNPPYSTIVADPPWAYDDGFPQGPSGGTGWSRIRLPYSSMGAGEIEALPVADLARRAGTRLFLWTTNRYLPVAFSVMAAWGFRYRQAITWRKTGDPSPFVRSVAPQHSEYLLVGSVGNPPRLDSFPSSVIDAPAQAHSGKPALFLDLVERVSPGPYLELFARQPRLGWDSWGWGYEDKALAELEAKP